MLDLENTGHYLHILQPHFWLPAVATSACTAKQSKERKTKLEKAPNKKKLETSRGETRVNIGVAVQQWWHWSLKTEAKLAVSLLDR